MAHQENVCPAQARLWIPASGAKGGVVQDGLDIHNPFPWLCSATSGDFQPDTTGQGHLAVCTGIFIHQDCGDLASAVHNPKDATTIPVFQTAPETRICSGKRSSVMLSPQLGMWLS